MSPDKLVYMVNQIATFFESQPRGDRVECIASHLNDYWEPGMRAQLLQIVESGRGDLNPAAAAAARRLRMTS